MAPTLLLSTFYSAVLLPAVAVVSDLQAASTSAQAQLHAAKRLASEDKKRMEQLLDGLTEDLGALQRSLHSAGASFVQLDSGSPPAHKERALRKDLDVRAAVEKMAKLGPHQMPAMVNLLKGMQEAWKSKISEVNRIEHEQKTAFDKRMKDLEGRKSKFKADVNASETTDLIEKYWKRQREISHHQYHTALKIMHSGMQKFKAVERVMQHAVEGKKPTAGDLRTIGMLAPDVVLLQQQVRSLEGWVKNRAVRFPAA